MINLKVNSNLEKVETLQPGVTVLVTDNNTLKGIDASKLNVGGSSAAPDLSGINTEIANIKQDINSVK